MDISVLIKLEEFEKAVEDAKLTQKLQALITEGMRGLNAKDIEAIEIIGGASRIKSIIALAQLNFKDKTTKRMNPEEAVTFGLGWLGAIRSSKYKIPYEINI